MKSCYFCILKKYCKIQQDLYLLISEYYTFKCCGENSDAKRKYDNLFKNMAEKCLDYIGEKK